MGTLSYTTSVSLDGYIADADGDFQWAAPSEELFRFHVERMRSVSHEIVGRRTYELMDYWESPPGDDSWNDDEHEFARLWRALPRTVVSATLTRADLVAEGYRLVQRLDMAELRRLVDDEPGEVEIFGPTTAAEAIRAGMVDDIRLLVVPRTVGGGLRALPDGALLELTLAEHRVFPGGTVYLHYRRT